MKINNNISAVITNNRLLANENNLAASMEKLSSGLKINHAKDNPSGIAIAKKMRAQIEGLDKASQNASDGVSVAQTADGALSEVTAILQRMRELSVQAANGTNTVSDKQSIQGEIDSLRQEIDRISSSTEFNTKSLLNGSLDARVYGDNVSRAQASSHTPAGTYDLTVTKMYTTISSDPAAAAWNTQSDAVTASQAGVFKINGSSVEITEGMSRDEVYSALRDAAELGNAKISDIDENLQFTAKYPGSKGQIMIEIDNPELETYLGITSTTDPLVGEDAEISLDTSSDFGSQATYHVEGDRVVITDTNGFELSFVLDSSLVDGDDISLEVTDVGPMDVQIGANEGQYMTIRIPACDSKSLYIDDIDVTTVGGALSALSSLDYALDRISATRSSLGAFQNRLETSVESLDETSENMTSALSRIEDVDMAGEMVKYTSYNVISQAATSALSQANELPQMALQLLQ